MAKHYMLPLLHRLANLRTEVATGRTRRLRCRARAHGRGALSEEDGNREWNGGLGGRKERLFGVRLRLLGAPSLPTRLGDSIAIKNFGVGVHAKHQAMQNHVMPCKNRVKRLLPGHTQVGENGPVKNGKLGETTTDHGGCGRRRPGSHAEPAARPGSLRAALARGRAAARAGQHYYSHLGLRPPSKDFDYNQPLIREKPNNTSCCATGRSLCVPCRRRARLTKLGKGFFRDKYYEYLATCR